MFKTFLIPVVLMLALVLGLLCYLKATNSQLIGHCGLRKDHLDIISTQVDTAKLMDEQHRELNRKLDLLLNIATNQVDGVRRMP